MKECARSSNKPTLYTSKEPHPTFEHTTKKTVRAGRRQGSWLAAQRVGITHTQCVQTARTRMYSTGYRNENR